MIDPENGVRLAVKADTEALFSLCKQLHEENGLFSFSGDKVRDLMDKALAGNAALMGVIGEPGKPEACIYLTIECPYYSDDMHMMELWNFVAPPRQKRAGHAKRLLEWAKYCSDEMQLPLVTGILSNQRVEAKVRLYERQLERAGAFFIYNRKLAGGSGWPA